MGGALGTGLGAGFLTTGLTTFCRTGAGLLIAGDRAGAAAALAGASSRLDSPAQRAERVRGSGGVMGAGRLSCTSQRMARCRTRAVLRQASWTGPNAILSRAMAGLIALAFICLLPS